MAAFRKLSMICIGFGRRIYSSDKNRQNFALLCDDANARDRDLEIGIQNFVVTTLLAVLGLFGLLLLIFVILFVWIVLSGSRAERQLREDRETKPELLTIIERASDSTLIEKIENCLAAGANPNTASKFGMTPLFAAESRSSLAAVKLLVDAGADISNKGWSELHKAVLFGTIDEVRKIATKEDLSLRSNDGHTPFHSACFTGDLEKAKYLHDIGLNSNSESEPASNLYTQNDTECLSTAAHNGHLQLVKWLVSLGYDVNAKDDKGETPLEDAIASWHVDVVEYLISEGADVSVVTHIESGEKQDVEFDDFRTEVAIPRMKIVRLLRDAGWKVEALDNDEYRMTDEVLADLRYVTGATLIPHQVVSSEDFNQQSVPRFGKSNPHEVDYSLWKELIRTGKSAYQAHSEYLPNDDSYPRVATWTFDRFGMTTTQISENEWVQIAGEHEDSYDPDFNIYSDVVYHDGMGGVRIFTYPKDVFPPTDFHTATLFESSILIVGSLGYMSDRKPGETQVLRLNLSDFSIETVLTTGENPGWISRHKAVLSDDLLTVSEGKVFNSSVKYVDYSGTHTLCLSDMVWREVTKH